jgi:hypothetical protein
VPSAAKTSKPAAQHRHACAACGWSWDCLGGTRCQVATAAKVNRQGPWCLLCLHLIAAEHEARIRQLPRIRALLDEIFSAYSATVPETALSSRLLNRP